MLAAGDPVFAPVNGCLWLGDGNPVDSEGHFSTRDDHATFDQSIYLRPVIAIPGQYFPTMLAKDRRAASDAGGGSGKFYRSPDGLHLAKSAVRGLHYHFPSQRLGIAMHFLDAQNRTGRQADSLQTIKPFSCRSGRKYIVQRGNQRIQIAHSHFVVDKTGIGCQRRCIQGIEQFEPVGLVGGPHIDPAVAGREGLVRRVQRVRGSKRPR